jgi:hypothetical protein
VSNTTFEVHAQKPQSAAARKPFEAREGWFHRMDSK